MTQTDPDYQWEVLVHDQEPKVNRQLTLFTAWTGIVIVLLSCTVTQGDSFRLRGQHWSANKKWVLKVNLFDLSVAEKLSLCELTKDGLVTHWQQTYRDDVEIPHEAYVTNDGKRVV